MGLFCRRGREQRCGGLCGCGGVPTESLAAASVLGLSPEGGVLSLPADSQHSVSLAVSSSVDVTGLAVIQADFSSGFWHLDFLIVDL